MVTKGQGGPARTAIDARPGRSGVDRVIRSMMAGQITHRRPKEPMCSRRHMLIQSITVNRDSAYHDGPRLSSIQMLDIRTRNTGKKLPCMLLAM